ncbi:MAG: hypothetical protein NUV59_01640, partial [Patescibacteria group bacterium]|nr:hypothetical protein [Patescibacteria group bacterium]
LGGYSDYGGYSLGGTSDYGDYSLGGGSDYGGYSLGGYSDYGGYSLGGYSDYGGYSLGGGSDYGGYSLGGGSDYGGYSLGGGSDYGGYSLGGGSDYGGYSLGGGSDYGGYSLGGGSDYGGYSLGGTSDYLGYTDYAPTTDVYGHEMTTIEGVGYSFVPSAYSAPVIKDKVFTFSAPSSHYKSTPHVSKPPVYNPPVYNPPTYNPPTYNPPVVNTPVPNTTTTTNNTCTGSSCNTSTVKTITNSYADNSYVDNSYVDNSIVDNSISGSYNTTVSNSGNTTTNVSTVKTVSSAPVTYPVQYTYPSYNPAPTCTISLSYGGQGGTATLTWYSSYATSAYITPNIGRVAPSGSMTVYPSYSTVYTLGVSGSGGSNSCQTQSYSQPYVAGSSVSLSQIPYTGFDLGPVGNALYWLSLLSFAVAGAYLLVYYRGGMLTLASAFMAQRKPRMAAALGSPAKAVQSAVAPIARQIDKAFASSASFADLSGATKRGMTTDTMMIERSDGKETPRIVISRR